MRIRQMNGVVELGVIRLDHIEPTVAGKTVSDLLEEQMVRFEFRVPLRGGDIVGSELVSTRQVGNDDVENPAVGNGVEHIALQDRYLAFQIRAADVFSGICDGRVADVDRQNAHGPLVGGADRQRTRPRPDVSNAVPARDLHRTREQLRILFGREYAGENLELPAGEFHRASCRRTRRPFLLWCLLTAVHLRDLYRGERGAPY